MFIVIVVLLKKLNIKFESGKTENIKLPSFYSYQSDTFKKWKWTWELEFNHYKEKWSITNLSAYCPRCDTKLLDTSSYYSLHYRCPRCERHYSDYHAENPTDIQAIIIDNIKRQQRN